MEDHDDSRIMIAEYLRYESMEVTAVSSVAEAIDVMGRDEFDALVSDLRLPDGDGYAVIAALRACKTRNKKIPAIGITAHPEAENRERALAAGFDDYLSKSSTALLARKLGELSRRRKK